MCEIFISSYVDLSLDGGKTRNISSTSGSVISSLSAALQTRNSLTQVSTVMKHKLFSLSLAFSPSFFLSISDDICDLKLDKPGMEDELTVKERKVLEENERKQEKEAHGGEGDEEQGEEDEEKGVKEEKPEDGEERNEELSSEEQELEELRAQVLQLLLELEEARQLSQKHEESFQEMQGEIRVHHSGPLFLKHPRTVDLQPGLCLKWPPTVTTVSSKYVLSKCTVYCLVHIF